MARRTLNLLIAHLSGARRKEHARGRYLTRSSDALVTGPGVTDEGVCVRSSDARWLSGNLCHHGCDCSREFSIGGKAQSLSVVLGHLYLRSG